MTATEIKDLPFNEVVMRMDEFSPAVILDWLTQLGLEKNQKTEPEVGGLSLINFGLKESGELGAEEHEKLATIWTAASKIYNKNDNRGQVLKSMGEKNSKLAKELKERTN